MKKLLAILLLSLILTASCVEIQITNVTQSTDLAIGTRALARILGISIKTVHNKCACRHAVKALIIFGKKATLKITLKAIRSFAKCAKSRGRNSHAKRLTRAHRKIKKAGKKVLKRHARRIRKLNGRHKNSVKRVKRATRKTLIRRLRRAAKRSNRQARRSAKKARSHKKKSKKSVQKSK